MSEMIRGFKGKIQDYFDISKEITVSIAVSGASNYDSCCFGVDSSGKMSDDNYIVFYNHTASPKNEVVLSGSGANTSYAIKLLELPSHICKLVFTTSIDGESTMAQIQKLAVHVSQGTNMLTLNMTGTDFKSEKSVIAVEIYKNDSWRIGAVASGFNEGLAALLKYYGVQEIISDPDLTPPHTSSNAQSTSGSHQAEFTKTTSDNNRADSFNLSYAEQKMKLFEDYRNGLINMEQYNERRAIIDKIKPVDGQHRGRNSPARTNKRPIMALIVCVCIAVLGVGIFMYGNSSVSDGKSTPPVPQPSSTQNPTPAVTSQYEIDTPVSIETPVVAPLQFDLRETRERISYLVPSSWRKNISDSGAYWYYYQYGGNNAAFVTDMISIAEIGFAVDMDTLNKILGSFTEVYMKAKAFDDSNLLARTVINDIPVQRYEAKTDISGNVHLINGFVFVYGDYAYMLSVIFPETGDSQFFSSSLTQIMDSLVIEKYTQVELSLIAANTANNSAVVPTQPPMRAPVQSVSSEEEHGQNNNIKHPTKVPVYKIVKIEKAMSATGLDTYWILTERFDYSTDAYREQIKAIITDVVYKANKIDLVVNVVSDADVIEVETNMNSLEEYGQAWWERALEKESEHWIVCYTGASKRSEISAYEITWFIADYTDREDDVLIEQWKPDFSK